VPGGHGSQRSSHARKYLPTTQVGVGARVGAGDGDGVGERDGYGVGLRVGLPVGRALVKRGVGAGVGSSGAQLELPREGAAWPLAHALHATAPS
jgi:hypothetical protein